MDIENTLQDVYLRTPAKDSDVDSDVLAKLRRLRIQESILAGSLNKCNIDQSDCTFVEDTHSRDYKIYSAKLKNSITEIQNMFEDIKNATSESRDNFKDIDIDALKKDVLDLDVKIKSIEDFMSSELVTLQRDEEELLRQMNEKPKQDVASKGKVRIQIQQYNDVVPSPVRVLINSPLKCAEAQKFQDFMSKSKNRYGGWNEYNHNTFVQIWNKFYVADDIVSLENNKKEVGNGNLSPQFRCEVLEKITGVKSDDIIQHSKWYSEYCYLKMLRQIALDKWRDNKRKIKRRQEKINTNISSSTHNGKLCRKQDESNEHQKKISIDWTGHVVERELVGGQSSLKSENSFQTNEEISFFHENSSFAVTDEQKSKKPKSRPTFATPTEQWIHRCNAVHEAIPNVGGNIDKVDKLHIPNWRLRLHEKLN